MPRYTITADGKPVSIVHKDGSFEASGQAKIYRSFSQAFSELMKLKEKSEVDFNIVKQEEEHAL